MLVCLPTSYLDSGVSTRALLGQAVYKSFPRFNLFINSSVIDYLLFFFKEPLQAMKLPVMIVPMGLLRPISGTATLAIMSSIMASYGPDSFAGNLAAVLQGCTDTTIYVLALYFGSVGVTKTRHALASGLIADIVGIVMAFIISYLFFW